MEKIGMYEPFEARDAEAQDRVLADFDWLGSDGHMRIWEIHMVPFANHVWFFPPCMVVDEEDGDVADKIRRGFKHRLCLLDGFDAWKMDAWDLWGEDPSEPRFRDITYAFMDGRYPRWTRAEG